MIKPNIEYPESKIIDRPLGGQIEVFPICQFNYNTSDDDEIHNLINYRSKVELELPIIHRHKINDLHFIIYSTKKILSSKRFNNMLNKYPNFKL